jgi:iron complex outermembrane receptor protein
MIIGRAGEFIQNDAEIFDMHIFGAATVSRSPRHISSIASAVLALVCVLGLADFADGMPATTQASPTSQPAGDFADLSLEDLMNVEVTSVSKKPQSIAGAPAAVTVISQDDIARSGFSTIPDLLRLVPGMDVARINSSDWAISARGLNGEFANDLLVLQDGRTLYTPLYGGTYWDSVDYILPDLDRIEVIRGPGATLWGANAVNGVINITTKDARDTQGYLLNSQVGSDGEDSLGLRYGGKLDDDTYYRVYGKARYFDEFDLDDGDSASDDWKSVQGGFRIDKHASDNDSYTLQGDVGNVQARTIESTPVFNPPFSLSHGVQDADTTGNLLGRWNHRVDDTSDFSLQIYYDYVDLDDGDFGYNQNTFDMDFHDRFMIGSANEISWGFGYRFVNGNVTPSATVSLAPARNDNLYSTFVQDTITLQPDRWFLTVGSKIEHNDYSGFDFEPSARLMWTPDDHNSLWGAVSRAARTPTRVENDADVILARFQQPVAIGATAPGEVELLGNPNQQAEDVVAYELGYRVKPIKQVSIDIATFYNNYSKVESVDALPAQPGSPFVVRERFGNRVRGDTWGGEIASTVEVTPRWRLSGSYSLLEAAFEGPGGPTGAAANDAGSAPQNQFQIHSSFDLTKSVQLNGALYFVGPMPELNVPSYFSTDLNVTWQINEGMSLQVGAMDLFDSSHPEYASIGPPHASQAPLTVYAELAWKF